MKKSQGEIFGIALLFVILIIGVLIYGQYKIANPDETQDLVSKGKYGILAETTLDTILKTSTDCVVERNKDRIIDVINFCMENSFYEDADPSIFCESEGYVRSCTMAKSLLNQSLLVIFNSSSENSIIGGNIPFLMKVSIPSLPNSILGNLTLTNFNQLSSNGKKINQATYRKLGFQRAPSGLRSFPTANRNIDFELYLYYKE